MSLLGNGWHEWLQTNKSAVTSQAGWCYNNIAIDTLLIMLFRTYQQPFHLQKSHGDHEEWSSLRLLGNLKHVEVPVIDLQTQYFVKRTVYRAGSTPSLPANVKRAWRPPPSAWERKFVIMLGMPANFITI